MKKLVGFWVFNLMLGFAAFAQVDTTFIYNTSTPYGTLDIRIAKSATRYYYLQENKTFSFRESSPGVKTDSYRDMTSWDSSPYTQGNLREKNGNSDYFIMNYRLLFPVNYNPNYADGYPMIVMMHGAGERANCWDNSCYWADRTWKPTTNTPAAPTTSTHNLLNNDHNLLHGGQVHLAARNLAGSMLPNDPNLPQRAFPGFILFAQNLNGWDALSASDAIRLIRLILKKYKVDQNRIYVHGLSNGGTGTYEVIKRAPWLFSAALPMSAISDAGIISKGLAPKMANIPLWVFQGGIDGNPTPAKTEGYVRRFREAGADVRYTKYPNLGHGVWNTAYNEADFFSWMLAKNKSNIYTFGGNTAICLTTNTGVNLINGEGFLAYQWEKDGAIIPGATSYSYNATEPGIYRSRFSRKSTTPTESQWNRWSDPVTVTEQNPAQAQVVQKGTILLKDLNNYAYANLSSANSAEHYYWYKDGLLINLPGSLDDTTRSVVLKSGTCTGLPECVGNGWYTLVTSGIDNCPSPPSEPLHIYFNNQAPINITAPTTFTGNGTSASTATVDWTDASNNEGGFEIWRRRVTGPSTYTLWEMAKLTTADVTSLNDTGLEPSSTYQYKIRGVSSSGRSNYTPSSATQYLIINTDADTQIPSTPLNLTATKSGIREITLNWQASTDNTGIRQYAIFFSGDTVLTGTPTTSYKLTNLPLNTVFTFTVKAIDLGGNYSLASNSASSNSYVAGLYYEHSTGGWTDLDLIDWSVAEFKGTVNNFTLTPRTQEDYFNFEFDGYLYINLGGSYQFRTTSDDGSRLTLNNTVIVDNDGLHGAVTVTSGFQTLSAGPQLINVKFFEYTGGQSLTVQYRGPDTGFNWVNIPDAALKSGNPPPPAPSANNLTVAEESAELESKLPENALTLDVFPNPLSSSQTINVRLQTFQSGPVQVKLMDMVGKSFYENTFDASYLSEGAAIMPRETLNNGIYVIIANQGKNAVKQKVIIKD